MPAWFAPTLRASGVDVVSAHELGLFGAADEEHLAIAAHDGRVLFTCNVADRRYNFVQIPSDGRQKIGTTRVSYCALSSN